MKPAASIVINNYNYGRYLREAIDSALAQQDVKVETIVVDDGSHDDSPAIIRSFGKAIRPILKKNGGQASALNRGLEAARGDWVMLLDADDRFRPEKAARVLDAARRHPAAGLIYHRMQNIDAQGNRLDLPWPKNLFTGNITRRVAASGGWWEYPFTTALCFHRRVLERILPIPEDSFRICADAWLAELAPFFGEVVGLPEPLAEFRLHGDNNWNNSARLAQTRSAMETQAARYELQVNVLNEALAGHGIAKRLRLEDHWPWRRLQCKLSGYRTLVPATWAALRSPGQGGNRARLRNAVWLWRDAFEEHAGALRRLAGAQSEQA